MGWFALCGGRTGLRLRYFPHRAGRSSNALRFEADTMLQNLAGPGGLPSPELINDVRTLCGLGEEELAVLKDVFIDLAEDPSEDEMSGTVLSRLHSLKTDPGALSASVRVALFLWQQWSRRGLTREQVSSDLGSLGVPPEQLANVSPLLDAMEQRLGVLEKQRSDSHTLGTGNPQIQSAVCAVDARAVFKSSSYEKELGEDQPYYQFDRFIPVAILEIVSELNDEKATHSYLMTEETLSQLSEILRRARTRLDAVKKELRVADTSEEATNGQTD